jgi:hypothetical protein
MRDELIQQLMQNHPHLFEKADNTEFFRIRGIECEDGWFNIIDVACYMFENDLREANQTLDHVRRYFPGDHAAIAEAEAAVAKAIEDLPVIQIVKEKFGTMRFFTLNSSEAVNYYTCFAEAMSVCTCEGCGVPATLKTTPNGSMKTLCDECLQKRIKNASLY